MTKKKNIAIRIPLKVGEEIRRKLLEKNLLVTYLRFLRDEKFLYLPVKSSNLGADLKKFKLTEKKFELIKRREYKSYKEVLDIPKEFREFLPTSFDIIGDIAIVKICDEILNYRYEIGNAILKAHKNVKTVCLSQPVRGEYRVREKPEILAGQNSTETVHKEFGLKFKLDVREVYFSPRLANERKRISGLVKNEEIVVDMFAGVCPFSIMIAKYADPKKVFAVEKNKKAAAYAKDNIKINNVLSKVEVYNEDSRNFSKLFYCKDIDRVIMNLPKNSFDFFPEVLKIVKNSMKIHFYSIVEERNLDNLISSLNTVASSSNIGLSVDNIQNIKSYSPREFYMGIDITAQKN